MGKQSTIQVQFDILERIEKAIESLTYPITGSPSHGKYVSGIICLHVDGIFVLATKIFTIMWWLPSKTIIKSDQQTNYVIL